MIALTRPECPNPKALDNGKYNDPVNKDALRKSTSGKCMYCECKTDHNSFAHIEHIKPKALDKFPELEFVWDNLGYSCQTCNVEKGDKYDNNTPFINPYNEDPEEHTLFFGSFLYAKHGSERGEYTINELKLNRTGLIERRKERLDKLNIMISAAFRTRSDTLREQAFFALKKEADKDKEYSAAVKSLLIAQGILK
ncbi:MAG: HNH endonuclease [Spirochaetes bacterium]|nr:HNH endonuclease [Spirochaetota bacterium]